MGGDSTGDVDGGLYFIKRLLRNLKRSSRGLARSDSSGEVQLHVAEGGEEAAGGDMLLRKGTKTDSSINS